MIAWFTIKKVPTWRDGRKWISYRLVQIAKAVWPECEECNAFMASVLKEQQIHGSALVKVPWELPGHDAA